jgi:hypothetical protein
MPHRLDRVIDKLFASEVDRTLDRNSVGDGQVSRDNGPLRHARCNIKWQD